MVIQILQSICDFPEGGFWTFLHLFFSKQLSIIRTELYLNLVRLTGATAK